MFQITTNEAFSHDPLVRFLKGVAKLTRPYLQRSFLIIKLWRLFLLDFKNRRAEMSHNFLKLATKVSVACEKAIYLAFDCKGSTNDEADDALNAVKRELDNFVTRLHQRTDDFSFPSHLGDLQSPAAEEVRSLFEEASLKDKSATEKQERFKFRFSRKKPAPSPQGEVITVDFWWLKVFTSHEQIIAREFDRSTKFEQIIWEITASNHFRLDDNIYIYENLEEDGGAFTKAREPFDWDSCIGGPSHIKKKHYDLYVLMDRKGHIILHLGDKIRTFGNIWKLKNQKGDGDVIVLKDIFGTLEPAGDVMGSMAGLPKVWTQITKKNPGRTETYDTVEAVLEQALKTGNEDENWLVATGTPSFAPSTSVWRPCFVRPVQDSGVILKPSRQISSSPPVDRPVPDRPLRSPARPKLSSVGQKDSEQSDVRFPSHSASGGRRPSGSKNNEIPTPTLAEHNPQPSSSETRRPMAMPGDFPDQQESQRSQRNGQSPAATFTPPLPASSAVTGGSSESTIGTETARLVPHQPQADREQETTPRKLGFFARMRKLVGLN